MASEDYFSINAGSSRADAEFTLTFSSSGKYYTLVKVFTGKNGSELCSRQGVNPDYVYGAPAIGTINYTSQPLKAGTKEKLRVTFTENISQITRTYLVKIYCVRNGISELMTTPKITILSGSKTATHTFSFIFKESGSYKTHIMVYNGDGTLLLNERTGKYPDTVYNK